MKSLSRRHVSPLTVPSFIPPPMGFLCNFAWTGWSLFQWSDSPLDGHKVQLGWLHSCWELMRSSLPSPLQALADTEVLSVLQGLPASASHFGASSTSNAFANPPASASLPPSPHPSSLLSPTTLQHINSATEQPFSLHVSLNQTPEKQQKLGQRSPQLQLLQLCPTSGS